MLGYKIWHKDFIRELPTNMLLILYQNLANYTYNPKVVKAVNPYKYKMNEFNKSHFYNYCCEVYDELTYRKLSDEEQEIVAEFSRDIYNFVSDEEKQIGSSITHEDLFKGWHNDRYYQQCFYALQEMYDYGLIEYKGDKDAKNG